MNLEKETASILISKLGNCLSQKDERISSLEEENNILTNLLDEKTYMLHRYKKENEKLILADKEKDKKAKNLLGIIEGKDKEIMDMLPYITPNSDVIKLSNDNKKLAGTLEETTAKLKTLEALLHSNLSSYKEQLSLYKLKLGICEKKYESEVKKNKVVESKLKRISSDFADFIIETADREKKPLKRKRDISYKITKKRKLNNKICYSYLYDNCYHNNCRLIHDKKMKSLYEKLTYLITKYTKKGVCFFHIFGICAVKSSGHMAFFHEKYIKGIKICDLPLDKLSITNKIEEFKAIA